MQNGENPMEFKKRLAREIIKTYHSERDAVAAQENWEKTFSGGGIPTEIPEVSANAGEMLIEVLAANKVVESKAEFRRLIKEGAVKIMNENEEEKITDEKLTINQTVIIKVGKKKFVKIIV
jgi:tyrosyl-tRNA synthetase